LYGVSIVVEDIVAKSLELEMGICACSYALKGLVTVGRPLLMLLDGMIAAWVWSDGVEDVCGW